MTFIKTVHNRNGNVFIAKSLETKYWIIFLFDREVRLIDNK